jgi:putative ABC transport system permease protein
VLERREDYALLKAMGASPALLLRVVLGQAGAVVLGGLLVGPLAYLVAVPVVGALAPAVPVALSALPVTAVVLGAFVIGGVGSVLPLRRIQRIDPGEVFRA